MGWMVSDIDEIDIALIAEGFTAGQSDEELDRIEEHVRPYTRSIVSPVNAKVLLTSPWSLHSAATRRRLNDIVSMFL